MSGLRALRGDEEGARGEGRLLERRSDEAPVVDNHTPGRRSGRELVGEAPRNRHRRLRIVRVVEIGKDTSCLGFAQPTLERMQEHRVLDFLPSVRAESRSDERRRSDYVVRGEARRGNALGAIPRVDSGRIAVDDRKEPWPDGALRTESIDLVREKRLSFRARDECAAGERQSERVEAGNVEGSRPRRAANELQQEPTVGRSDPTRAESDVDLGLTGDVGDSKAVSHDRHARSRPLPLARLVGPEPERSGLEEPPQVSLSHAPSERSEPVVELPWSVVFRSKLRLPFSPGGRMLHAAAGAA